MKKKSNEGKGHLEKTKGDEGVSKSREEQDDIKEVYGIDDNDEYAG
jgi:hypothetical protein